MKLNITRSCIIFIILITTTGCFKKEVTPAPVNSYAIEKSGYYKHNDIQSKILNETSPLYMSYPFSMQVLLLTEEAIIPLIPLSDKGVMSQEYYLNTYNEEQNLIYEMFKKRKSFSKLHVEHVNKINSALNNKKYDFVMYFDSSVIGELDIYLKDTATGRTFLVWKDTMTKIDPIQKVEHILKSKMLYCAFLENEKTQEEKPEKIVQKTNLQNKHVQNNNSENKNEKSASIAKTSIVKTEQKSNLHDITKESLINIKETQNNNYYNAKKDSAGCYAYGPLNQCVVW